jgi:hypothetical protein
VDLDFELELLSLEEVERFGSSLSSDFDGRGSFVEKVDGGVGQAALRD